MRRLLALALMAAAASYVPANAHGGGVAADGCHFDRKAGTRHCHGGGAQRAAAPAYRPQALLGSRSGAFANCAAARAAGAAPVRRGDAGYAPHLDRDGDGVGCE